MGRSLLLVFLFACGNVQEEPVDAAPDVAVAGFTIAATTPNPSVPIDGMNVITLSVTRTGAFAGDVTVEAMSPPSGLTVSSLTIPAADTSGAVRVGATTPLTIGGTVTIVLRATGDGVDPQTVTITDAPLTGRPGSLDTAWAGTGLARVSFGGDDNGAFQSLDVINGAVVATGTTVGGLGTTRATTMRLTSAGVADATWNGGAPIRTGFTGSSGETNYGVATGHQNDGRSVIIGHHVDATNDIDTIRYSVTGGAGGNDYGDGTGKSLVNLGGNETVGDGLVLESNAIVAVGAKDSQLMVARLTPLGLIDTTFNAPNGFVTATLGTSSQATDVVADTQDRLVVAGSFNAGTDSDVFIRRYTPTGALDGAFGGNNGVIISGADSETAAGLAIVGDKILVASSAGTTLGRRIRVRRYATDGTLDTTFGTQGVAEYAPSNAGVSPLDLAVMPDGRIVVLARDGGTALVIRFTPNGAIDTLFGTANDGTATVTIGGAGRPECLEVSSEHLLLVAGGDEGGSPGPGTFGIVARMWM